ncbi:DUF2946 family protein [Neorhizobium petrolearium]|uniref:DUF2946 family protein n=1 Tax=Neorhizobium petrolearium TaxID=515361 RepID=UPI003F1473D0
MRFIRQIIGDSMSGGVLSALIAVMLLLQGAIGGYAQAGMASSHADAGVICTEHGADASTPEGPSGKSWPTCCGIGCQALSSLSSLLPVKGPSLRAPLLVEAATASTPVGTVSAPHALGLAREARAPPTSSIRS